MESTFKMEKKNEFCIWDVSKETITEKLEVIKNTIKIEDVDNDGDFDLLDVLIKR